MKRKKEKLYELTLLFLPKIKEEEKIREEVRKEIEKTAKIEKEEDWGEKKLAYPVKKNERGHFYFYELKAEPKKIKALDGWLKLNENIIRYLIVLKF
ncbi:30S ribosomal protein S6 [Candidatus Shapirobacteria bacterium]|nr:30S ribosomal protein S6 [Candidatus Shapirobacteria bacterium]